jgi:general secretion pathway protein D
VIRDSAASNALTVDRYEAIRALQQQAQPTPSTLLHPVSGAPVLPPLPARPAATQTNIVTQPDFPAGN